MGLTLSRHAVLAVGLLLTVFTPVPTYADWFLTPFLGYKFRGRTSIVDLEQASHNTKLTFGASVSRVTDGILGVEVEGALVPGYFERENLSERLVNDSYVVDLSGNAIISLPLGLSGGGLRPYFTAGLGLMHAQGVDIEAILRIRRTMPAITLGGGATGPLTNRVSVRFDLRYLRSIANQDEFVISVGRQLSYWRGAVGIAVRY